MFTYDDPTLQVDHQIWFDTPATLETKYRYAKKLQLHGVGVNAVNDMPAGSAQHQMWRSIQTFLKSDS
jgi:spore germination protein YaaH